MTTPTARGMFVATYGTCGRQARVDPAEGHCQLGLLLAELPHAQLPRIPVST